MVILYVFVYHYFRCFDNLVCGSFLLSSFNHSTLTDCVVGKVTTQGSQIHGHVQFAIGRDEVTMVQPLVKLSRINIETNVEIIISRTKLAIKFMISSTLAPTEFDRFYLNRLTRSIRLLHTDRTTEICFFVTNLSFDLNSRKT